MKKWFAVLFCMVLSLLCAAALANTAIDEAHFPDENFREAVKAFDTNGDNVLDTGEISNVKAFSPKELHIRDLTGIEVFTELENLNCSGNELTSLDLSRNAKLIKLVCSENQLSSLDLSHNLALVQLSCHQNQLTKLNLGKNTVLEILICQENSLTSLDLSRCASLRDFSCTYNQLKSLDLSGKKDLTLLDCYQNKLTRLNVTGCSALTSLTCNDNLLTALDVSSCVSLELLGCDHNSLTDLTLGQHPQLNTLYANHNSLSRLDVRGCPVLCGYMNEYPREAIYSYEQFGQCFCFDPGLTIIGDYTSTPGLDGVAITAINFPDDAFRTVVKNFDQDNDNFLSDAEIAAVKKISCSKLGIVSMKGVEHFTALEFLLCSGNQGLTSLDLSKNTSLTRLYCENCAIETLNTTKLTALTALHCFNNKLKKLNVTKNTKLESLDCSQNHISVLDIRKNTKLESLGIASNPITSIDLSKNTHLREMYCYKCPLTQLNLGKCRKLRVLWCWQNAFTALDVTGCPDLCEIMNTTKREKDAENGYDHFAEQIRIDADDRLTGDYISESGKNPTRLNAKNGVYSLSGSNAALLKPAKATQSMLEIADTVQANGKTYKVTAVADKACKGLTKLKTVTLGKNVKGIGKQAFASCTALKTVKGGAAVTTIGDRAFAGCKKLDSFPNLSKLQKIGNAAFSGCTALKNFFLGSKVTSIGKSAFYGCKVLQAITVRTTKLTGKNTGEKSFSGIHKKAVFSCPKGKVKAYASLFRACGAPKTAIFK